VAEATWQIMSKTTNQGSGSG